MISESSPFSRRRFLESAAALTAGGFGASALAVTEPYTRVGQARLRLGLAAYSFRNYFKTMRGKPNEKVPAEDQIEMTDFIRFCAEHNCGGAELTSYFFDPDVSDAYLAECRHLAHVCGIEISGTAVGNNFSYPKGAPERAEQMTYVKDWIDKASILGAPHIRVFAGKHPEGVGEDEAEKNASEALEEAAAYAGSKGIFLGIENHDSIGTADRLLRIVKNVKSPWVGVNLDTGNFRAEDPYPDIEATAPYAVNVQVKVALKYGGETRAADLERIGKILHDTGYQGYVTLEYEENDNPFESVPPVLDRMRKFCDC
ncbi:MAG: sugar phosphate isomerase/epimerase [Verrucomicrobiae bacterium]|nr:sugar phosphate isomerase/epimerase [Verrucomicrobiae bacterium]